MIYINTERSVVDGIDSLKPALLELLMKIL